MMISCQFQPDDGVTGEPGEWRGGVIIGILREVGFVIVDEVGKPWIASDGEHVRVVDPSYRSAARAAMNHERG